jgi:hypothetical protein
MNSSKSNAAIGLSGLYTDIMWLCTGTPTTNVALKCVAPFNI